jgi:Glycosyl hydrolase family 71
MFAKLRRTPSPVIRTAKRSRTAVAVATAGAVLLSVFAPAAASAATAAPATREVVLTPSESTWITTREPADNKDRYTYLSATSSQDRSFLKFDTSDIGADETVVSAKLELTVNTTAASAPGVQVFAADHKWAAASLTAVNRPAATGIQVAATSAKAVAGKTVTIPITNLGSVYRTKPTAFELAYAQRYVGTTFHKQGASAPKLRVVLSSGSSAAPIQDAAPAPVAAPAPAPVAAPAPATPAAYQPSSAPSFNVAASNSTAKKVFAHYFPPYPISLDNKAPDVDYYTRNYLKPSGENGKFASVGGLLRDRPVTRAPLGGDWQVTDLVTEINQAANSGIDGFTVNIMSWSGRNWDTTVNLFKAAKQSGRNFTIVPNLDATSGAVTASVDTIATKLAELYKHEDAYRLSDGRYVLSSFKAEGKSVAWWTSLRNALSAKGVKTAFIAVLLDSSEPNQRAFAPISYAVGDWGTRNPEGLYNRPNRAAIAHSLGVKWISGVGPQDVRPNQRMYAEARNTETLRAAWSRSISDGADMVQLVTWNDYSEGTTIAPSVGHGSSFLDISSYYSSKFKTGTAPKISKDNVYVSHRKQFVDAKPTYSHALMAPNLGGSRTTPVDQAEVYTFLTAPAKVTLTVGSTSKTFDAPAGVFTATMPLKLGTVKATVVRDGATVARVDSPHKVVSNPYVQDLQYHAASSRG